jgi:uncharacterized alkaline shock family protein YloU
MDEVQGKVTIAPTVLTTIVRQTALEQNGVSRLAPVPPKVRGLLTGGATEEGIFVAVTEPGVQVELHVVADAQSNMLKLGSALQAEITRALEEMVGMPVVAVDVYIDDVATPATKGA